MAIFIEIKAADGTESRTRIEFGTNRFSVKSGDSYRFVDEATGFSPVNTSVARLDNNLLVTGLDRPGEAAVTRVELVEFYNVCSVGSPCQVEVQTTSEATPVIVTSSSEPIGALADGSFILYDPKLVSGGGAGTPATVAAAGTAGSDGMLSGGFTTETILYGVGGLALVGLALSGGGGSSGGDTAVSANPPAPTPSPAPAPVPAPPATGAAPAAAVIAAIAGDNVVTLSEKVAGVTITGTGTPGTTVALTVDSTSRTGVVDASGKWAVALTAGEIGSDGQHTVNVVLSDSTGLSSPVATHAYSVNTASGTTAPIATDNIVNGAERVSGVTLSGTGPIGAPAGTTIDVTITGAGATLQKTAVTTTAGSATAGGAWSTLLLPTEAIAEGAHAVSASARVGTVAGAASNSVAFSVDTIAPVAPVIDTVAGDNIISLTERAAGISITGRAELGSSVLVSVGGTTQTVSADATGIWKTLPYSASAFPLTGTTAVTATATDKAGNVGTASAPTLIIIEQAVAVDTIDHGAQVPLVNPSVLIDSATSPSEVPGGAVVGAQATAAPALQFDALLSGDAPSSGATETVAGISSAGNMGVVLPPGGIGPALGIGIGLGLGLGLGVIDDPLHPGLA